MNLRRAHELLGATENTPIDEVKSTYRLRSRMIHPDTHHDPALREEATKLFREMNEAWEVIQHAESQGTRQERVQMSSLAEDALDDEAAAFSPPDISPSRTDLLRAIAGLCLVALSLEAGLKGGIPYADSWYPWIVIVPFATGVWVVMKQLGKRSA